MRKHILFAAMAALGLLASSCIQERNIEGDLENFGRVSFVLDNMTTRAESTPQVETFKYRLGTDEEGITYTLYETVMEMDGVGYEAPETRGTPAYTENVKSVHGSSFNGVAYGATGQVAGDGTFDEVYGVWRRDFGTDPWATSDPLTFFLRMPASPTGLSNLAYTNTASAKTIAFDYTVPTTASDQKDILFAIRELSRDQYKSEASNVSTGASVLFRHALTGVKFAIGNNASQNGITTFITKVVISGLKSQGHAVFNPDNTEENYSDNPTVFSSANSFEWTNLGGTKTFSQTYSDSDIVDFAKNDAVGGPDSFYAAGTEDNLNKADGSLTFWFIPQAMTEDVKMTVTFYTKDGNTKGATQTLELDLGTRILAQETDLNHFWKAGQLRTFTLSPSTISVDITDIVENKTTKKNIQTRNTGNKSAWMRVAFVGNWVNSAGQIVAPWKETDGTFTGLGGNGAWLKGSDGFWYYQYTVPAGGLPSVPVFATYTKPSTTPSGATGLQMDLTVQVIDSGLGTNFAAAWAAALGGDDDGIPAAPGDDDSGSGD